MGSVVWTKKEVRTCQCKPGRALRQYGSDGRVISLLPGLHTACQSDAIKGHIWMIMGAEFAEAFLAERAQAKRCPFHAVSENADMLHAGSNLSSMCEEWREPAKADVIASSHRASCCAPRRDRTSPCDWKPSFTSGQPVHFL